MVVYSSWHNIVASLEMPKFDVLLTTRILLLTTLELDIVVS